MKTSLLPIYEQPSPQQTLVVAPGGGGNRNAKNLLTDAEGREWSHGLCDCCADPGTCVFACCCPCIIYGQNKQRYEHLTSQGIPDPERGGGCSNDASLHGICTVICCLGWVFQIGSRGAVRERYHIKGSALGDCLTACCCIPCELTQEHRELELEERSFQRLRSRDYAK